jgi:hypothetical protein
MNLIVLDPGLIRHVFFETNGLWSDAADPTRHIVDRKYL